MLSYSNKHLIVFSEEQKQRYINYVVNSAKISFDKVNNGFTKTSTKSVQRCRNQQCSVIIHNKDMQLLWTKEEYLKNYQLFSKQTRLKKDKFQNKSKQETKIWICRFCGTHEIVDFKDRVFMNSQLCFRADEEHLQKKNSDPIILFLIDWSSSMQELILSDEIIHKQKISKQNRQKKIMEFNIRNKTILQLIKESSLVSHLRQIQASIFEKAMKLQGSKAQKQFYINICKNHLLLAIIEKVLKQIKNQMSTAKTTFQPKYGFLFFNDHLFLAGDCQSQKLSVITSHLKSDFQNTLNNYFPQNDKNISIEQCDYHNYDALFEMGASKAGMYQQYLNKADITKMKLNGIIPQGKTAMGPAIAMALGIVSKHGQGSNIVVITDGLANEGLLSSYNSNVQQTNQNACKIKASLNKHKSKLGILQWKQQKNNSQNSLDTLVKIQPNLVTKFEVNLDIDEQKIKLNTKNIIDLAFRQRIENEVVDIQFKHNVDFIKFQKCSKQATKPNQQKDYRQLINNKSTLWYNIKIDQNKIDKFYFAKNPIYTQLIITMKNIDNDEVWCYVSEIEQFITKNKYKTLDELNYNLAEERIQRCQLEGNSFKFDQLSMAYVNKSISARNFTQHNRTMELEIDEVSKYSKATQYNISFTVRNNAVDEVDL